MLLLPSASDFNRILIGSFSFTCFFGLAMMYEVLFCFCILLHWRVFLPLVESSCQIWFPMLTFAFLSLPLLRKTDVKIRKQTEKRETKRKQETVFYVFLRVSLANIWKFKLSLKALILSAFAFLSFQTHFVGLRYSWHPAPRCSWRCKRWWHPLRRQHQQWHSIVWPQ